MIDCCQLNVLRKYLLYCISDEQGLKVFVDLAMISAGEDDMEIDRISCMHTSCLGFGSLIFGCNENLGFKELMKLCKPVWQVVDANPTINAKLVSFVSTICKCRLMKKNL